METVILHRPPPVETGAASSVTLSDLEDLIAEEAMGKDELTPTEVAREFNVSPATVRRWEKSGILVPSRRLPGSKHRRYSRSAVEALKREQDQKTGSDQPAE